MKLGLNIRNPKKAIRPSTNDVIIYDGKEWYVTTKEDLFREFDKRINTKEKELNDKIAECNSKIAEMNELKASTAKQILEIANAVRQFISKEGK